MENACRITYLWTRLKLSTLILQLNIDLRSLACPESADIKGFMYALQMKQVEQLATCDDVQGSVDKLNEQVANCDTRHKLLDCVKQKSV